MIFDTSDVTTYNCKAVDGVDLIKILESVWVRLSLLCAPIHDEEISRLRVESRMWHQTFIILLDSMEHGD